MGNRYYLARDYKFKHLHDAGSKARMDIEQIMEAQGFLPAGKQSSISKNRLRHFVQTLAIVMRMPLHLKQGDLLVVQYPTKYYDTICRWAHRRGALVVTFIHDLGCFRQKCNSVEKEIRRMNSSDGLIGCNPVICKWLANNGFIGYSQRGEIETLHIFDFLSNAQSPDRKSTWPMHNVVYAGQLTQRKNSFLYKFGSYIEGYTVNVYGRGFDSPHAANPEKFHLKGFMRPDDLIQYAEGDFGLVWDGDSIDRCSGNWGEYLAFNTPHKVSLYIRSGLPLILWREAAMATFVKENGIGICIDSLCDIPKIYERITPAEYYRMCDNVQRVSRLMSEGYYFGRAVSAITSRLLQSR